MEAKAIRDATSNVAKGGNVKLLVTGAGGREHSIVWKLAQNSKVEKIYVCPGNAGCETVSIAENVNLKTIYGNCSYVCQQTLFKSESNSFQSMQNNFWQQNQEEGKTFSLRRL